MVNCQLRAETTSSLLKQQKLAKSFQFLIEIIGFSLTIQICENQEFLRNQEKWHLCNMVQENTIGFLPTGVILICYDCPSRSPYIFYESGYKGIEVHVPLLF